MRYPPPRRTLGGVPGSLTRRQLLIRTGGASVALTCFGALAAGAVAEPAALNATRAATFGALLDAISADPAYALADRDALAAAFERAYTAGDESLRLYADSVLDAIERAPRDAPFSALRAQAAHRELVGFDGELKADALSVATLAVGQPEDSHTIVFSI